MKTFIILCPPTLYKPTVINADCTPFRNYVSLKSERNVAEGEDRADLLHGLGRREAVGSRVALSIQCLEINSFSFKDKR